MKQSFAWILGMVMVGGTLLILCNTRSKMPPAFYGWFIGICVAFVTALIFFVRRDRP